MPGTSKNDSQDEAGRQNETDREVEGQDEADRELEGMAYEPSVNQIRTEPVPASHEEDKDQEGVVQNEEHSRRSAGQPNPAGHGQAAGAGRDEDGQQASG
jgi:hypothetical protein